MIMENEVSKLLKVLKNKRDRKVKYQDDILQFLNFYNIKSGRQYVKQSTLKKLYYAWSQDPVLPDVFITRMNEYFRLIKNKYYNISQKAMNLSTEAYEALAQEKSRVRVVKHEGILLFLKEKGLNPGKYWFSGELFFFMYQEWVKMNPVSATSKKKFNLILSLYLPTKTTKKETTFYGVNQDLRHELATYEKAKKAEQKRKERQKAKQASQK